MSVLCIYGQLFRIFYGKSLGRLRPAFPTGGGDADRIDMKIPVYRPLRLVAPVKTGMEFTELQVQEIKNQTYTGSPVKPAIQVYAPDQTSSIHFRFSIRTAFS